MDLVTPGNCRNRKPNGPFGAATVIVNIKNTETNRKRLQTLYFRQLALNKKSSAPQNDIVDNEINIPDDLASVTKTDFCDKTTTDKKSDEKLLNTFLKKSKLTRTSISVSDPENIKSQYCFCKCQCWEENGPMVECQACKCWYHYNCVLRRKRKLSGSFFDESNVRFVCGVGKCKFRNSILVVNGKYIPLKNLSESSYTFIGNEAENNPCLGTTEISTDLQTIFDEVTLFCNKISNIKSLSVKDKLSYEHTINNKFDQLDKLHFGREGSNYELKKTVLSLLEKYSKIIEQLPETLDTGDTNNVLEIDEANPVDLSNCSSDSDIPVETEGENQNKTANNMSFTNLINDFSIPKSGNLNKSPSSASFESVESEIEKPNFLDNEKEENMQESDKNSEISFSFKESGPNNELAKNNKCGDVPLSKDTISSILGVSIPNDFFTYKLPRKSFKFDFDPKVFRKLKSAQVKRCFAYNSWQKYFLEGIRESNPYCVFMFKYHSVSSAKLRTRKNSSSIFKAEACCKFSDCTCKVNLKMFCESIVHLEYSGFIKHDISEQHARPLSGESREDLKDTLRKGEKPLNVFLQKLNEINPEELIAGNMGNIGLNSRKIAQVGVEARHKGRFDSDLISSLILQKQSSSFIRKICASPMYLLYWSEHGLKIYNELASKSILFWDATGTVVRKSDENKRFLYYELAIAHPIEGKMGIPISSMLSENQSITSVLDWLRSFRHAEKAMFGYNNTVNYPKIIISDQSMVFILSALKEFNNEDLSDFLKRSYNIAKGRASCIDCKKTIVHLCKSHYMNSVKRYLRKKEISLQKVKVFLYVIGILMKCDTLSDFKELLLDVFVFISSKFVTPISKPFMSRLMQKINTFQVSAYCDSDFDDDISQTTKEYNPNRYCEEDFQIIGSDSPFKTLALKTFKDASNYTSDKNKDETNVNVNYCPLFLDYLLKTVIPIFPLWSSLLLGNLQRFNRSYPASPDDFPSKTTNSLIENRFRILKHISLNDRSQHRIDEFSEALNFHTVNIQKKSALECLKTKKHLFRSRKRKPEKNDSAETKSKRVKRTTLMSESWNKSKDQPDNLKRKHTGTYQQPPKRKFTLNAKKPVIVESSEESDEGFICSGIDHTYSSPKPSKTDQSIKERFKQSSSFPYLTEIALSDFHKFKNLGQTCWLNSVLQAYYYTKICSIFLRKPDSVQEIDIEPSSLQLAFDSITDIWRYMFKHLGAYIPEHLLRNCLLKTCLAVNSFSQSHQQDAHEFISSVFSQLSESVNSKLELMHTHRCVICNNIITITTNEGHCFFVPLEESVPNLSLQVLLDNHFSISDLIEQTCINCHMVTNHSVKKSISCAPETLAIVLGRYKVSKGHLKKIHTPVLLSDSINFSHFSEVDISYNLKSVVCHKGNSTQSGHYVTAVKSGDRFICCDDTSVNVIRKDNLLRIAYIAVYNRSAKPLPALFKGFLYSLKHADVFCRIIRDEQFKYIDPLKQEFIKGFSKSCLSTDLENLFENDLESGIEEFKGTVSLSYMQQIYKLVTENLFGTGVEASDALSKEFFRICYINFQNCTTCCKVIKNVYSSYAVPVCCLETSSTEIYSKSIEEEFLKVKLRDNNSTLCSCDNSELFSMVLSLPQVLMFVMTGASNNEIPHKLNFSTTLQYCYPVGSMDYSLKTVFFNFDSKFRVAVLVDEKFIDSDTKQNVEFNRILNSDYICLLYVKTLTFEDFDILKEKSGDYYKLPPIDCVNRFSPEKSVTVKKLFGVKLSKEFYSSLINATTWLNSDHINLYLNCMAAKSSKKVHVVDSGWFSKTFFLKENLYRLRWNITVLESKKGWFEKDFIVIPVNEKNSHWHLVIVDMRRKCLIYCSSFGTYDASKYILFQLWRYLCYEAAMHSNLILDESKWKIVFYSKQPRFPKQTDSSSCGVYVCAVSKSVIEHKSLPIESNLQNFRFQMAFEISQF